MEIRLSGAAKRLIWEMSAERLKGMFQTVKNFAAILVLLFLTVTSGNIAAKTIQGNGYIATDDVQYNWIDISQTGTEILSNHSYYGSTWIGTPIDFTFYGNTAASIYITTGGLLTFSSQLEDDHHDLPYIPPYGNYKIIAPYWSELLTYDHISAIPSNAVFYEVIGTQPARQLIVQWQDVESGWAANGAITFQVILYEDTNEIKFQYKDVNCESDPNYSNGASAAIGIQGPVWASTDAVKWSFNQPVLKDQYAVLFKPVAIADPIALNLSYISDVNVTAEAEVTGNLISDYQFDQDSNSASNESLDIEAYVFAWGLEDSPEGEVPTEQEARTSVFISCDLLNPAPAFRISAEASFDSTRTTYGGFSAFSWACGEMQIHSRGTVQIGSSEQFQDGTRLKAFAQTNFYPGQGPFLTGQTKFWYDDPNDPVVVITPYAGPDKFYVTTGSTLNFESNYYGSIYSSEYEDYFSTFETEMIETHLMPISLLGDLNSDGIVNFMDYAFLQIQWPNTNCVDPGWCDGADINKNGTVSYDDLKILCESWLKD